MRTSYSIRPTVNQSSIPNSKLWSLLCTRQIALSLAVQTSQSFVNGPTSSSMNSLCRVTKNWNKTWMCHFYVIVRLQTWPNHSTDSLHSLCSHSSHKLSKSCLTLNTFYLKHRKIRMLGPSTRKPARKNLSMSKKRAWTTRSARRKQAKKIEKT